MGEAVRFKQSDVTRAFKGALAAGIAVRQVEIDPSGKIVILPEASSVKTAANEWDEVLR